MELRHLTSRGYDGLAGCIASGAHVPPYVIDAIPEGEGTPAEWDRLNAVLRTQDAEAIADQVMEGIEENVVQNGSDYDWDPKQAVSIYGENADWSERLTCDAALEAEVLALVKARLVTAASDLASEA
ncbi:hypothetical protein [Methylobacterium sp. Leaf117]|uniref:hypothetical protein n=1 Tax=Methylobacterium sp. Leaf117 TaxID=1736260 RepID=UPI000A8E2777|nr:hypothetical protein [Methylobacterium sp. Leaf117]